MHWEAFSAMGTLNLGGHELVVQSDRMTGFFMFSEDVPGAPFFFMRLLDTGFSCSSFDDDHI